MYNTAEFRRSDGPKQHNAHAAWDAGSNGAGVTIAVIDTGIDSDSPEFAGRILPTSKDMYDSRDALSGPDDHGTNVAMVAAAARDNTGVLGIAWGANLLAIRADEPGTCAGDNPQDPATTCGFLDSDIARAIDYAVANGASIINISLGGEGGANAALQQSVRDATSAGVLVVIAAGNDGFAQLDDFARQMIGAGNSGLIVVGSVDENYQMSDFSNLPGTDTQFYLAARGEAVCCTYDNGTLYVDSEGFVYLYSGTSFASPQVAGAAALLAQAFPNLTGQQIAEILLRTAFDAGATGDDAVYGRGILDINAAFQPIGTTSLAGSVSAIALADVSGTASPAMGDALSAASLPTVITDEYDRAYATDLAGTLRNAALRSPLHDALGSQQRYLSAGNERGSVAFSIDARGNGPLRMGRLDLSPQDETQARVLAARATLQIAKNTQFGFAYAQGADGLVSQLQARQGPAFMIAGSSNGDAGISRSSDVSFALRQDLGGWGLTLSAESGKSFSSAVVRRAAQMRGYRAEQPVAGAGLSFDRRFGNLETALGVDWMGEERTFLGAHLHEGFALAGADSLFVDFSAGWQLADNWRLGGQIRQGWTQARMGGSMGPGSQLTSRAFALDLSRRNLLSAGDTLAIRLSQPLRVEHGQLNLSLPVSYDYETLTAQYGIRSLSLAPSGRELDAEIAWSGPLLLGNATASLFYRKDPGHFARTADDGGLALRWSTGF
ncbi:S8 family serine peptidase [Altererythrobacter aestuarii]|uniref:S8 family serine peptidase n=1 Tax=Alteraurantiacibacter aestuarii TaxID=650004 RepID=A0A844ZGB4_9SPHN|nr:S8 family serine peptidase [Alteraurantiacibacter aestuarii]